jgi:hypothetical protein
MEMRMSKTALKAVAISTVLLSALGLTIQTRHSLAAGQSAPQPLVQGISVHKAPDGAVTIDISITGPVPYRTLKLSRPERLVVDLKGVREADLKGEYPAESQLLERVRASQWKDDPAVVRIVADLKGDPAFKVRKQASGIRIELKPRGAAKTPDGSRNIADAEPSASANEPERQTGQETPSPKTVFQVHRFKDLSASLTAPVLPPHDRLVPVADPELHSPGRKKEDSTVALVSGISIRPDSKGAITIDIASSRSVPYRVFQLADPFRLVIDLKDARNTSSQEVYQVNSPVLKRVRVGQWRPGNPSVVRVVADLEGYPIFDVHAQRPGIRIELRSRHANSSVLRNPFVFQTKPQRQRIARPAAPANQAVTGDSGSAATASDNAFSGLKVIGFIEKKGAGTQAVISHRAKVYLVSAGGTFENTFTVLAISANAVEVQNKGTLEKGWIAYTP